jgi:hypothetical protein
VNPYAETSQDDSNETNETIERNYVAEMLERQLMNAHETIFKLRDEVRFKGRVIRALAIFQVAMFLQVAILVWQVAA